MRRYPGLRPVAAVALVLMACGDEGAGGDRDTATTTPGDTAGGDVDPDTATSTDSASGTTHGDAVDDGDAAEDGGADDGGADDGDAAGDDADVASGVARATIGAAGGTLVSLDGVVTITVPPDAVDEDTVFTITLLADAPTPGRVLDAYRLGPEDVDFSEPVTVALTYAESALGGVAEAELVVTVLGDDGTWQEAVPSAVDAATNTVSAPRWHFSDYSAGRRWTGQRIDVGDTIYVEETALEYFGTGELRDPVKSIGEACRRVSRGALLEIEGAFYDYARVTRVVVGAGTYGPPADGWGACTVDVVGAGRDQTRLEHGLNLRAGAELSQVTLAGTLVLRNADVADAAVEVDAPITMSRRAALRAVSVSGSHDDDCVLASTVEGHIEDSVIQGCRVGISALRDTTSLQVTDTTVRETTSGIVSEGMVTVSRSTLELNGTGATGHAGKLELYDNIIRQNHVGVLIAGPATLLGNLVSCNGTLDLQSATTVDATGNTWDHVPPHAPSTGDEGALSNDIDDPSRVTTTGARLADKPCRRPKRQVCAADEKPPATATFGTDLVCRKGVGGVITCGGTFADRTNICQVDIPPADVASTCAGTAFVVAADAVDAAAPATLVVDTSVNGCTSTRTATGYTSVTEGPSVGVTSVDACDFRTATGQTIAKPAAPETLNAPIVRPGTPIIADGLDTEIPFGDFPGFNGSIIWSVEYGAPAVDEPSGSILDSIAEVVVPSAPGLPGAPAVPSVTLASQAIQDYLTTNDLEAKRVRICLANNGYDTTLLPDERVLQLACVRCVSLTKEVFEACSEEICDGKDNDCDASTDEGCPYSLQLFAGGVEGELIGRTDGTNTFGATQACGTYNVMTGAVVVSGGDGKIWQFAPHCAVLRLADPDTASVPYGYTVAAGDGSPATYSPTGVSGVAPPSSATVFTPECPAGMVVRRVMGEAGDDIAKLQLECVRLELSRAPDNVWTIVAGATHTLPVMGTAGGTPFDYLPPEQGGMPRLLLGLRIRYPSGLGPGGCCGALTTIWGRANGMNLVVR